MRKKKKVEQDTRLRGCRGGSWFSLPGLARVAWGRCEPGLRFNNLGVRLVRRRSALERLADALRGEADGQEVG